MNNNTLSTAEMREAFFIHLYKNAFPAVARYVAKMGGSLEQAQDIFQDALIIYYEKTVTAQGNMVVNQKAYMLGVAKNLWLQYYRTDSKIQPIEDIDIVETEEQQPTHGKLMYYLATTGKKCMELLKASYYDALPLNDVVRLFNYSGTHSATVAKYKCLEKVRDTVKQQSLSYADFIE